MEDWRLNKNSRLEDLKLMIFSQENGMKLFA